MILISSSGSTGSSVSTGSNDYGESHISQPLSVQGSSDLWGQNFKDCLINCGVFHQKRGKSKGLFRAGKREGE